MKNQASSPPAVPSDYFLREIDSCRNCLALLLEYLGYLREAGQAATVWGLEDLLDMIDSRLGVALDGLKERQENLEARHV